MLSRKGFTLIELVILLLIIGIISIVVITDFVSSLSATRLEAAKWKLKSDIIYAQSLAVTQQINHGVVFDPSTETYSVYRQNTANIVNDPLTKQTFTVNYATDSNFKGIDMVSTSFGSPTTNQVEFDSFGIPYSTTGIALSSDGTATLSSGDSIVTITVTKNTGKVN